MPNRPGPQGAGPVPLRDRLPYGLWTCADGREVLFDRRYRPLWTRRPGEAARVADPDERVPHCRQEWFWQDGAAPWQDGKSLARAEAVLAEWQVGAGGRH